MPFQISGQPITFNAQTFTQLVEQAGGKLFRWKTSSMGPIRTHIQQNAGGAQIVADLQGIAGDKAAKYKKAIKYLVYHYPNMVGPLNNIGNAVLAPPRKTFLAQLATQTATTDYKDLVYGCDHGRQMAPYVPNVGRPRFCDDFNNAANLGTGFAFDRQWNGQGFLTATPQTVQTVMQNSSGTQTALPGPAMNVYTQGLMNSRYNPATTLTVDKDRLGPNKHKDLQAMQNLHGQGKTAEKHMVMHARFVYGVRRACKGGIAMVASDPQYRQAKAQVHFILDGLGDLGAVAYKYPLPGRGEYVAITSSELGFCFRYWNDPQYPLSAVVKLYVNGDRVTPPWEANWTKADAVGNNVFSNQEAWLRYGLYRSIVLPGGKAFPVWNAAGNGDADDD